MEFLEGSELFEWCKTGPDSETLLQVFREICLGVEQIHSAGICHRDLKPENIFVTAKNEIKIYDFGTAKDLELNV